MKQRKEMRIFKSNGTNQGYCRVCKKYFKKNDYYYIFLNQKLDRVYTIKVCVKCFVRNLVENIGTKKLNDLILNVVEEKI